MLKYFKNRPTPEEIAKALFLSDIEFTHQNILPPCISVMPNSIDREQEMQFLRWMNEIQQSDLNQNED